MAILREFSIHPRASLEDLERMGSALGAFHRTVDNQLARLNVKAPFAKIALEVRRDVARPGVFLYQGILHAHIPGDPLRLTAGDESVSRKTAAGWANAGLDAAVEAYPDFDPAPVRRLINAAGEHVGVYREVRDTPAVTDGLGRRWVPAFEWDADGAAFVAEAPATDGLPPARVVLCRADAPWELDWDHLAIRRTSAGVTFVTRAGQIIGTLALDGPAEGTRIEDEAMPRPGPDPRPPRSRPRRGDMALDDFWSLIARVDVTNATEERAVEPLVADLASRTRRDRRAFARTLARLLYDIDGRAWARRMGDGWYGDPDDFSPDVFLYARCAVVARGREYYETVRADPAKMEADQTSRGSSTSRQRHTYGRPAVTTRTLTPQSRTASATTATPSALLEGDRR